MSHDVPPVRTSARSCRVAGTVAALAFALLAPVTVMGDDTDVYAPPLDPGFRPTLMFMVDTSNSMRIQDYGSGSGWRRDRLLGPLVEFIRTARDVRAGLSSFNGVQRGGAVLYPAQDLDHDLCPDAGCGEITVRSPIVSDSDDGQEDLLTGRTNLFGSSILVGELANDRRSMGVGSAPLDGSTVVETASGGTVASDELTLFRNELGELTRIGLHFPDVTLPEDVDVYNVRLAADWFGNAYLDPDADEGSGRARARITFDARPDSPPFAGADGQPIGGRPTVPGHVDWNVERPDNWQTAGTDSRPRLRSPDLSSLFRAVRPPGTTGSITVMIEPAPGFDHDDKENVVALLGSHGRGASYGQPRLSWTFRDADKARPTYRSALRFDRLEVPKGARITGAHLEVMSARSPATSPLDLRIRAESSGHALPFEHRSDDFSTRALGADVVDWTIPSAWRHNVRHRTPDLAALVQQVVSRADWCAGNALALHIDGEGEARIRGHDGSPMDASALHVSYDPASVEAGDTCRTERGQHTLLLASSDDVVQAPGGPVERGLGGWDSGAAGRPRLGLRFSDVDLGPEDEIASAILELATAGPLAGKRTTLQVRVDSDTADAPFDGPLDLAERETGEPGARWISERIVDGGNLRSVNLAPLVRAALADPGWRRGADLVLTVRYASGHRMNFATSHATGTAGPTLRIARRLRGQAAIDSPLLTSREALVERVQTLPALGETPVLDAFFETARYMIGGEVVHGRRRGEQRSGNRYHRLSHPDSYTDGHVLRPMGCDPAHPEAAGCVDETIEGNPVYTPPPSSQCRANQIVLVTDGEPAQTATDTPARIRALTGTTSCEATSDSEACAAELAGWLDAGDADRAPVRVSTIGFGLDSPFLDSVAAAGGGRAYSVSSGAALSLALTEIGRSAAHEGATLTGPSVSVSQFNRASHRDDVYLGLFEPAGTGTLWPGNIKRYGLGPLPDDGFGLIDAEGLPALDPATGRFAADARSWWSATADGAAVPRGGAASRLPSERRLLTWPAASVGEAHGARTLVDFDEGNASILAADLGVDEAERTDTIRWLRGFDVLDEDGDTVVNEARRRMGAAIHTTPAIIDYATSDPDGESIVFAGTQEGFLHAIDTASGRERFGFLPFELYRDAAPLMAAAPGGMRYGLDGPVTAWTSDENRNGVVDPGESAYVTVGMRRGGGHYYTLDVSDPDEPSLAWTIDRTREGFEALRQTWSAMRPATLRADPDETADGRSVRPALVFASGYDPVSDDRTEGRPRPTRRQQGGGEIYLIDPHTGDLLHGVTGHRMWYPIPSDVSVVDVELDGITDMLLVGDLAGQLWRVNLVPSRTGDGSFAATVPAATVVLDVTGFPVKTGDEHDRRFFHAPDVALMSDGSEPSALGVAIGTGRRDHPLQLTTRDRLYMLTLPRSASVAVSADPSMHDATDTPGGAGPDKRGWYIDMERPGEKVLGSPVIVDGRVLFTSYVPGQGAADPCEPDLGTGRFHAVDAFSAAPVLARLASGDDKVRSIELDAGGIPPPVSVVISAQRPGELTVMAGTQSVEAVEPGRLRRTTYWATD